MIHERHRRDLHLLGVAAALLVAVPSAGSAGRTGQWASASLSLRPENSRPPPTSSVAIDPRPPYALYAGSYSRPAVYRTVNGGRTWKVLTIPSSLAHASGWLAPQTMTFDARGTLYVGTFAAGVLRSTDSGRHWEVLNGGLQKGGGGAYLQIRAIAVARTNPQTLYLATNGGIFKSTNAGHDWHAVNTGLTDLDVHALAVDPQSENVVYIGTTRKAIFKTGNGGANWTPASNGVTATDVRAIVVDPVGGAVYAGTLGRGVFKSVNGGTTWSATGPGYSRPYSFVLAIDPTADETVYSAYDRGIVRTVNGGASWTDISTGAPKDSQSINSIAVSPDRRRVYASTFSASVLYYPSPLDGVVYKAWVSASQGGKPAGVLPAGARAMWAHFVLAAAPVHGPVTTTYFGPRVKVVDVVKPRALTLTSSLVLGPNQRFRPGVWRIVLRVRSTVLATIRVRVA
jgi:photosystem II stability/assembly factor-like uncharacterized protein